MLKGVIQGFVVWFSNANTQKTPFQTRDLVTVPIILLIDRVLTSMKERNIFIMSTVYVIISPIYSYYNSLVSPSLISPCPTLSLCP